MIDCGARTDKRRQGVRVSDMTLTAIGTLIGPSPVALRPILAQKTLRVGDHALRVLCQSLTKRDGVGLAAADAPETKVLAAFNNKLAASTTKLKLFIDYHSYSQLFMTRKYFRRLIPSTLLSPSSRP